jgi:hypothetical protein
MGWEPKAQSQRSFRTTPVRTGSRVDWDIRHDGVSRDVRDGQVLISDRLRLDRAVWLRTERIDVAAAGVEAALPQFGL